MPGSLSRFPRARRRRTSGSTQSPRPRQLAASVSVLAVVAGVTMLASAAPASAAPRSSYWGQSQATYWVAATGKSKAADTSCRTAAYSTVQAAVTAAETAPANQRLVPTIEICPGTYTEQVTITKSLTLTRATDDPRGGPVTIEGPSTATGSSTYCQAKDTAGSVTQSVIEVCAAGVGGVNTTGTEVTVSDVTVEGDFTTPSCAPNLYGILVEGGASLSLADSTVEKAGIFGQDFGCQTGVGVEVGSAPTSQIGHAYLTNDTVESYQKNGITVDNTGSTADIDHVVVTGAGPTSIIAQNGIQVSFGATASVTDSTITGNNYTGTGAASSTGILAFGGGGTVCGLGTTSPLVEHARFTGNTLAGNDEGIALANYDPTCTKSAATATEDVACSNVIQNSHGYPGGKASADANISGYGTAGTVGYQAGVSDAGNRDVICDNAVSGAGYAPLDATSSLPDPPAPAFVRPIDIVSGEGFGAAIDPQVYGNSYDGRFYNPS